jgi:DNA-binding LytR/AlgR family response regulator
MKRPTALVADDEPLLREALVRMLAGAWPTLDIVAQARNGREAIELFDAHLSLLRWRRELTSRCCAATAISEAFSARTSR